MARIAFILGQDFEDSEFRKPFDALREAGHQIDVLGAKADEVVRGKLGKEQIKVDKAAGEQKPSDYQAMVIPGGYSPDHLRTDQGVMNFVSGFIATGRLVAAVCHGPQLLIQADAVAGRRVTSWPSVRRDLENAGAKWVDQEVVIDGQLITSRKPQDLAAFSAAIIENLRPTMTMPAVRDTVVRQHVR